MAVAARGTHRHAPLDDYSDVVNVFEPGNESRPTLTEYIGEVWKRRTFIRALARADIQGESSNTTLGRIWAVLDPLIQAAIYWLLITLVRGSKGGVDAKQSAALIIGMVFLFTQIRVAFGEASRELMKRK